MRETKYKEIWKLHQMLTEAGVRHLFVDREERLFPKHEIESLRSRAFWQDIDWGWQILIYDESGNRLVSAVEGFGTHGESSDRIEIMGLLSPEERKCDSVVGWLTAENVFARIRHHMEGLSNE